MVCQIMHLSFVVYINQAFFSIHLVIFLITVKIFLIKRKLRLKIYGTFADFSNDNLVYKFRV